MSSFQTVNAFGDELWRNEAGQLHHEDGPASIQKDGFQVWWLNGKLHREDGPAAIYPHGAIYWAVNGKYIDKEVKEWIKDMSIEPDYTKWTDKEKMWFKLRFIGIAS